MIQIHPGMAEIQAKTCCRRFPPSQKVYPRGNFRERNVTATRFGLYLCHPWTDFSHFFDFENPNSIF
jgi:hypothetical protein